MEQTDKDLETMEQTEKDLEIRIKQWPTRDDLEEYKNEEKGAFEEFLVKEFDTEISFLVKGVDLLSGYPESFILPLHAFLRSLTHGLRELAQQATVEVPLYLQQYEIEPGCPAHLLRWRREGTHLYLGFQWGGIHEAPVFLQDFESPPLDMLQIRQEIIQTVDLYACKIAMLLSTDPRWQETEIAALLSSF